MDTDDLEPPIKSNIEPDLETLSIKALRELIAKHEGKIEKIRQTIKRKEAARNNADSFFKS
jgi:uncharacterized small protein (DUF1192 family)